ncbi:MAG: NUDIX domain-containing protein [Candidatus Kerfeldbacteria bacterium]|nr:NUDIX domain-containing protein [Candidatus Kerfeldbacteria bacterium]
MIASGASPSRGVTVIIYDPQSKRLLLLHRVLHWSGWEFVKGHVAANEAPADAARRETAEETGLTLTTLNILPAPLTFRAADGVRTYQSFLGTAEQGTVTVGPEHDGFRWVPLDEARTLLTPAHHIPLEAARPIINQTS